MTSAGGLTGLWIVAFLTLHGAGVGETRTYSINEPDVPFPPARPTAQNLAAICLQGEGRPRYMPSFFPRSGMSHLRRRGNAINRLESWFGVCCGGGEAQQSRHILCCAQQAWHKALSQFCEDEVSIMTQSYECCEERGDAQWTCFSNKPPSQSYGRTPGYTAPHIPEQPGFTFDTNACRV